MTPGTRRGTRKPGTILRELVGFRGTLPCSCLGRCLDGCPYHDLGRLLRELRQSLGPYQKGRGR